MAGTKNSGVVFTGGMWARYRQLLRAVILPHQHRLLHDEVPGVEPSHAIQNLRIAAGLEEGAHAGFVFQDSDLAKWLEAVGYSLGSEPDPALEAKADEVIRLIEAAQQPDGYFNTFYIINGLEKRFTNLMDCHELYCLGHLIEAAVAYYEGTGKRQLLDVVCRYTDLVDETFGPEEGKLKGCPGHQEIELALLKLYDCTGEVRYLRLAGFFLDTRGTEPNYFIEEWEKLGRTRHFDGDGRRPVTIYCQAHEPVRQQRVAVGHAVRAVYMYTAMAGYAAETGDKEMLAACEALWEDITQRQMYITGAIGQAAYLEAFTMGYDLPNDTVYGETCAAIGLMFFARAMLGNEVDGKYADVMERALYNTVLAGMGQDGKRYFYVNALEAWPEASRLSPARQHVVPERPGWYACACCPPNVARLLASLERYFYTLDGDTLQVHLYGENEAVFELPGGRLALRQRTGYPYDGNVRIEIMGNCAAALRLRVPGWCGGGWQVKLNGEPLDVLPAKGYIALRREWLAGDVVELHFEMKPRYMAADPRVRADRGRVALTCGPLVYCLEQAGNEWPVYAATVDLDKTPQARTASLEGTDVAFTALLVEGGRAEESGGLYIAAGEKRQEAAQWRFTPYYLWGNRGENEMLVWLPPMCR